MDQGIVPSCEIPNNESGKYVGAYVKEPIPGMYKWVVSCDLNSLYPHLQMGINISPEKRVPDSKLPDELKEIRNLLSVTTYGIDRLLDEEIDTSVLKKYNVTISPNGQFYRRDSDGFIPIILEGLYAERKAVKRSMLDDKQKMEDDPTSDLTNQIAAKNTLQMALKILMNSEYGAMGNQYFRYFDLRNAEAVTSSGQLAIRWVAKHLNIFLNNILQTENADYVIAIDTDSVYLNLEYLVEKFISKDLDTMKTVDILDGWASKVLEPEIERIYDRLANYINAHKQKMVMAREVIADKGFWTGKKRYALNVYDNEGVRYHDPKTKIMGLECVRSSVPEFCRNHIKKTIVKILSEDEESVQEFIVQVKDKFMEQPPEEISFPRGTNNIEKWIDDDGSIKKGCPVHVRGCIVYNNFLDKIGSVDEHIQSGDKIKFCNLQQPNIFRSHVVAYPPAVNKRIYEEMLDCINYEQQWIGTFYKPVEAIMECVGWTGEKIVRIDDFCQGEEY
jgi:DNA polymerase elongation subunit (family B)